MERTSGPAAGQRNTGPAHPALRHLGAMHLSGVLLLLTFLVPPFWMLDAADTTPPGDPTADSPFILLFAVPAACAMFHVLVQIPAGLLGARPGGNRTAPARYGSALAAAGVLSWLLLRGLGWDAGNGIVPVWADAMVRGSLGLAGYVRFVRSLPGSVRRREG
ncbi:hypothetical protein KBZ10_10850 [Streptomyces sp. F63]|uniref:hypothetical protein n=1 Tax=Streptomyces sp. F63 TaxID=2824887 RepID=UPI001B375F88|nr:hypothetical protein [Streptomyces sp. F63]MBQ0985006.1 hypothetical protein [Streptomyces sp. F63]